MKCTRPQLVLFAISLGLIAAGVLLATTTGFNRTLAGIVAGLGVGLLFGATLMAFFPDAAATAPARVHRRYLRKFLPAMAAYVVMVVVSIMALKELAEPLWLRGMIAVLPVLPLAVAIHAFIVFLREVDEMQQRIELESLAVATAAVSLITLTAGFLQSAGVIAIRGSVALLWVFPMLCMTYGIAKAVLYRRYQ